MARKEIRYDGYLIDTTATCLCIREPGNGSISNCSEGVDCTNYVSDQFDSIWDFVRFVDEKSGSYGGICDQCQRKLARHLGLDGSVELLEKADELGDSVPTCEVDC